MNALAKRATGGSAAAPDVIGLMPPLTLLVGILILASSSPFSSYEVTWFNVYDVLQNFGVLGLVTLALGLTMIAGEFDLSVASMYSLGGMIAVKTGEAEPALGFLVALAVGPSSGSCRAASWRSCASTRCPSRWAASSRCSASRT